MSAARKTNCVQGLTHSEYSGHTCMWRIICVFAVTHHLETFVLQHPGSRHSGAFVLHDDIALLITDVPLNFNSTAVQPVPSLSTRCKDRLAIKSDNLWQSAMEYMYRLLLYLIHIIKTPPQKKNLRSQMYIFIPALKYRLCVLFNMLGKVFFNRFTINV